MIQIVKCQICDCKHDMMRDHCPACGARRVILATHSYEPQASRVVSYRADLRCELVRAYRSDLAFSAWHLTKNSI